MIQYSDYHGPSNGAYAAIDGKLVPLADAAPKLAANAMALAGAKPQADPAQAEKEERNERPG